MASGDKAFVRYLYDFKENVAKPIDQHDAAPLKIGEILRFDNFISPKEEEYVLQFMSGLDWEESKSNVKKQEFGPTIDFTEHKVDCRSNTGLPRYSRCLLKHLERMSDLKFEPDRQRLLELCASHDSPEFSWITTVFHDHHWLFTDVTVLICLQSDIVVCLDSEIDGPTRVEVPMQARTAIILRGDATHRQINVDAAQCLTRCLLITYNCVKPDPAGVSPEDVKCIKYFRDKYVGLAIHEFAKYFEYVYPDPPMTLPLIVQNFEQHHLPIDVVRSVIEQTYKDINIESIKIVDGVSDINMVIQLAGGVGKLWGKLAVCSSYINKNSLDSGLKLQDWLALHQGLRVPKVIKTDHRWTEEESRSTSVTNSEYSVSITRNREHFVWLMDYVDQPKLWEEKLLDVEVCFRKVGLTMSEFHEAAAKFPNVDPEAVKHFPHFLSSSSYQNDLDVIMKKVFLATGEPHKQKLLICCLHRLLWYFKTHDKISAPTGIIHTYFHPKNVLGSIYDSGSFFFGHFAYIRHGFLMTDLILTFIRFYVFLRVYVSKNIPPYQQCMEYMLKGYGRQFDEEEKPLLGPFMLGLCALYVLETLEGLAVVAAEFRDSSGQAREMAEVELKLSWEAGFKFLEELCSSWENVH